jgi:hypothetical protein
MKIRPMGRRQKAEGRKQKSEVRSQESGGRRQEVLKLRNLFTYSPIQ